METLRQFGPISLQDSDVLNVVEAAAILRVLPGTLRKRAVEWGVPRKNLGTERRFSRNRLLEWLQSA